MGRKLVRENEFLRSGGLLSFPRTGCALRASVILSREKRSRHYGRTSPVAPAQRPAAPESRLFLDRWSGAKTPGLSVNLTLPVCVRVVRHSPRGSNLTYFLNSRAM